MTWPDSTRLTCSCGLPCLRQSNVVTSRGRRTLFSCQVTVAKEALRAQQIAKASHSHAASGLSHHGSGGGNNGGGNGPAFLYGGGTGSAVADGALSGFSSSGMMGASAQGCRVATWGDEAIINEVGLRQF